MDGMDLLQGVQDAGAETAMPNLPPDMGEFKMPSLEQMMDLLSKMDIPDEEKEKIMEGFTNKADVMAKLAGQGAGRISDAMAQNRGFFDPMSDSSFIGILWVAFVIMILIIAFFGYKLYKSLTDKERKREEKRKLKLMKKKK